VIRVVVTGSLTPAEVAALGERACAPPRDGDAVLLCDVAAVTHPDAGTVDALARLELTARRHGRELRLRDPPPALRELLELCGLAEVLRVEPRRQPEQREQPLRVQERVEMGDPPVL
jgi:anti-anti-sigma regulatory factor